MKLHPIKPTRLGASRYTSSIHACQGMAALAFNRSDARLDDGARPRVRFAFRNRHILEEPNALEATRGIVLVTRVDRKAISPGFLTSLLLKTYQCNRVVDSAERGRLVDTYHCHNRNSLHQTLRVIVMPAWPLRLRPAVTAQQLGEDVA